MFQIIINVNTAPYPLAPHVPLLSPFLFHFSIFFLSLAISISISSYSYSSTSMYIVFYCFFILYIVLYCFYIYLSSILIVLVLKCNAMIT